MVGLRELQEKDIEGMLEWMHDPGINCFFRFNAQDMDYDKAYQFISQKNNTTKHFAIVNSDDEYLGTISLKEIDLKNRKAEYAISIRRKYHGTGVATAATDLILKYAYEELQLHRVYLNVLSDNARAIRFYEKYGFRYEGEFEDDLYLNGEWKTLKWYAIVKKLCL